MNSILEIEKAIEMLPELEQRRLASWFAEHRLSVEASAQLGGLYDLEEGGETQMVNEDEAG